LTNLIDVDYCLSHSAINWATAHYQSLLTGVEQSSRTIICGLTFHLV